MVGCWQLSTLRNCSGLKKVPCSRSHKEDCILQQTPPSWCWSRDLCQREPNCKGIPASGPTGFPGASDEAPSQFNPVYNSFCSISLAQGWTQGHSLPNTLVASKSPVQSPLSGPQMRQYWAPNPDTGDRSSICILLEISGEKMGLSSVLSYIEDQYEKQSYSTNLSTQIPHKLKIEI